MSYDVVKPLKISGISERKSEIFKLLLYHERSQWLQLQNKLKLR